MKRALLLALLGFAVGTLLTGCQDSPWGMFSPKTDLHITKIEPFRIALDRDGYAEADGKAVLTPRITNGISAMIKGATTYYISQSNRQVDQRAIVTQVWIPATEVIKEDGTTTTGAIRAQTTTTDSTTTDSTSTTAGGADGVITLQIGDERIYKVMTDRGIDSLMARIVLFGTDENGNDFEITTQMPVALEKKDSSSGS